MQNRIRIYDIIKKICMTTINIPCNYNFKIIENISHKNKTNLPIDNACQLFSKDILNLI